MYKGGDGIRQTKIYTAELLGPERSASTVEMKTEKLKRYKSSDIDQIPAELSQEKVGQSVLRSTNLF
jgi:hypothetical protein